MRYQGKITKFSPQKGGFGFILSNDNQELRFEKCECNYENIRVGDEIEFHIYKSANNELEALNIEFLKNKVLSELDSLCQKKTKIECQVKVIKDNGLTVEYKGILMYLPKTNLLDTDIIISQNIFVYVQSFSYNKYIIVTQKENRLITKKDFEKHFNNKESVEIEIISFNDGGILCKNGEDFGFIPNLHIHPFKKQELITGQSLTAKVLSYSFKKGFILSVRNNYCIGILQNLNDAYKNRTLLTGILQIDNENNYSVLFEDLELKTNKDFIIDEEVADGQEIQFKIIDFSFRKNISVSNIEISQFGIIENFSNSNQFIGTLKEIYNDGLIIDLNYGYKNCFLPMNEISDILPWNFDYEKLKIGARIKVSITRIDYKGIYLSRLLFKKKERIENASFQYQVGQRFELKIKERAIFGLLVSNDKIKGLIHLENMLPKSILPLINKTDFAKHCNNIFKRNSMIVCLIVGIDKLNKKINFDLDFSLHENTLRAKSIISFFEYDKELYDNVENYFKTKIRDNEF